MRAPGVLRRGAWSERGLTCWLRVECKIGRLQQIAAKLRVMPEKAACWRNRVLDGGLAALDGTVICMCDNRP